MRPKKDGDLLGPPTFLSPSVDFPLYQPKPPNPSNLGLKETHQVESRGVIDVKDKGEMPVLFSVESAGQSVKDHVRCY